MTQDRIANWGESEAAARYQTGDDDPTGGDFIVARDLDGQRMLLKFDFTADEWQYAGDIDMGGGDLNSVGTARVDALEADDINTPATGVVVRLDGDQTIASDVNTDVEWDREVQADGEVSDLLDAENSVVVVPEGYSYAKVSAHIRWSSATNTDAFGIQKNDSFTYNGTSHTILGSGFDIDRFKIPTTDWFRVSKNDEISMFIRQVSGSSSDLQDDARTYMGVRFK